MKIIYNRPVGISRRDIILVRIYIFGGFKMKYSGNYITTEEELDIEVEHFLFLRKYNLV